MDRRAFLGSTMGGAGLSLMAATAGMATPFDPFAGVEPIRATPDRIFRTTVCLRPFRAAGPRIEVEEVGRAKRVELDEDIVDTMFNFIQGFDDFQNSMHTDVEQGRPLELEALSGAVVRMGRKEGVPTPVNEKFYAALLPHINGTNDVAS